MSDPTSITNNPKDKLEPVIIGDDTDKNSISRNGRCRNGSTGCMTVLYIIVFVALISFICASSTESKSQSKSNSGRVNNRAANSYALVGIREDMIRF